MPLLTQLDPQLFAKVSVVLLVMKTLGFPMRICQGVRTTAEQQALYAQGRHGNPGDIVTNCDGVMSKSNHQVNAAGVGVAVDCCFLTDPFGEKQPWRVYGEAGKSLGLVWGGDWKSPVDRPHLEVAK